MEVANLKYNKNLLPEMKDRWIWEKEERLDPKYERNVFNGLEGSDMYERIIKERVVKR